MLCGIYRMRYKRSAITAEGTSYIGKGATKEWFDDIISIVESLGLLSIVANREFENNIAQHAANLREHMNKNTLTGLMSSVDDLEKDIKNAAIRDLQL